MKDWRIVAVFVIDAAFLSAEGLPMDAAFRHPLAVIHGGDLPIRRRFRHRMQRFVIGRGLFIS